MHSALIALGANIGSESESFAQARAALKSTTGLEVVRCSSLYRTAPVGDESGGQFVNAAIAIQTELSPLSLLDRLQQIEKQLGREKTVHWGPRIIDLDLILYGDRIVREARLNVPHPACWYRRFVLDPCVEIAAKTIHPIKKVTLKQLAERLAPPGFSVAMAGGTESLRTAISEEMQSRFPETPCSFWNSKTDDSAETLPTILAWLGADDQELQAEQGTTSFEDLPSLPRLDLTQTSEPPSKSLRYVIEAAIDRTVRIGPFPENKVQ